MSDDSEEDVIYNPFEAFLNIGRHLLFRKEYKKALIYLDRAQGLEERNVPCMLMRATCHLYLTKNDEAITVAKKAHALSKRNPHAIHLIAEAYYRKGEFEMALNFFTNGKRLRPSISAFNIGICKCEQAIKNNCGNDLELQLGPDMDLTDYYNHAFPTKPLSSAALGAAQRRNNRNAGRKKQDTWPEMMPLDTLSTLFGKTFAEYLYTREIYRVEGKRATFLKQISLPHIRDVLPRIQRCEENRKTVLECANCLRVKADLWYKMDPSMKHETKL